MKSLLISIAIACAVVTAAKAEPIVNLNPPTDCHWQGGALSSGDRVCEEKPDPNFGRAIVERPTEWVMGACSGNEVRFIAPAVERIVRSGKRLRLTWSVDSACLVVADNVEARNGKVCVGGWEVVGTMHPMYTVAERNANYRKAQPSVEEFLSGRYDRYWFHRFVDDSYLQRDLARNLPLYRLAVFKQMFRDLPNPGHFSPAFRERQIYSAEMTRIFGACR